MLSIPFRFKKSPLGVLGTVNVSFDITVRRIILRYVYRRGGRGWRGGGGEMMGGGVGRQDSRERFNGHRLGEE